MKTKNIVQLGAVLAVSFSAAQIELNRTGMSLEDQFLSFRKAAREGALRPEVVPSDGRFLLAQDTWGNGWNQWGQDSSPGCGHVC